MWSTTSSNPRKSLSKGLAVEAVYCVTWIKELPELQPAGCGLVAGGKDFWT